MEQRWKQLRQRQLRMEWSGGGSRWIERWRPESGHGRERWEQGWASSQTHQLSEREEKCEAVELEEDEGERTVD